MRRGVMAAMLLLFLCIRPEAARGEQVGSSGLINQARAYDGLEVVYSGEVIGDILSAGDHVWLNISDGANAIGVWADRDLARDVQVAGRYDKRGDTVRVLGTFARACPEHGGDFDLHARSVVLVQRGYPVTHDVARWKGWLAVLLTIGAAGCMVCVLTQADRKLLMRHDK